jgi:hypothetical protein
MGMDGKGGEGVWWGWVHSLGSEGGEGLRE